MLHFATLVKPGWFSCIATLNCSKLLSAGMRTTLKAHDILLVCVSRYGGANSTTSDTGQTLLHRILSHEGPYEGRSMSSFITMDVDMLVEAGLDINATDNDGRTLLHVAVTADFSPEDNMQKLLLCLVRHGLNVNAQDNDGRTALHTAGKEEYPNAEVVDTLLKSGADETIEDDEGKTVAEYSPVKGFNFGGLEHRGRLARLARGERLSKTPRLTADGAVEDRC